MAYPQIDIRPPQLHRRHESTHLARRPSQRLKVPQITQRRKKIGGGHPITSFAYDDEMDADLGERYSERACMERQT